MQRNPVRRSLLVLQTPAMAAGVTDRVWEVSNLVALLEASERSGVVRCILKPHSF